MLPARRPNLDEVTCTTQKRLSNLDLDLLFSTFCCADPSGRAFKMFAVSRILRMRIRIPSVSFECCVLSLCDGPITRPDEIYRAWCV